MDILELLLRWVKINSWSDNRDGLEAMQAELIATFSTLPAQMELLNVGLIFRCRPKAAKQVLMGGHFDTVYPPKMEFPIVQEGNILHGPGVADMKGGLAILFEAVRRFETTSPKDVGWTIFLSNDEELGSPHSCYVWEKLAPEHDMALLFEPALPGGKLASRRKSSRNFNIEVVGKAAHVGRDPDEGRSAVGAMAELICSLEALGVVVGTVSGGTARNVVPAKANAQANLRCWTVEDRDRIWKEVNELRERIEQARDVTIKMTTITDKLPKPAPIPLLEQFATCGPVEWADTGGVCDGNILAASGLPTVDNLGACGGKIHSLDEYIEVDSLEKRTALVCRFLESL